MSDSLYRALRLAQAPLVNNGICAPQHPSMDPRKINVSHISFHFFGLRTFGHCIIILHKLCLIHLHKYCIIIVHKLCLIYSIYAGIRRGPISRTASLRRAVRDLGLSSESKKKRDYDYAEMTRIMHLHNHYAKFMHFIMQSLGI